MSDDGWEGLGSEDGGYAEYLGTTASPTTVPTPAPTPVGPLVSPLSLGAVPPSSPRPAAGPSGPSGARRALGDFSPAGVCEIRVLAKLAYLFYSNVSLGDTSKALATLSVFRYLFNDSRATIVSGFSAPLQGALPTSVPDVSWSSEMQRAVGLSVVGAGGESNAALRAAIGNQPGNMAALAAWFPTLRAALAPGDIATITDYASSPIVTTMDYGQQIARFATDDLRACLPSTAPAPTVQYVPTLMTTATGITQAGSSGGGSGGSSGGASNGSSSSGGGTSSRSGSSLLVIGLVALVGYGGYLTWKDSKEKREAAAGGKKLGALPPGRSWLVRDLGPRGVEFERLNERAQRTAIADAKKADASCVPGDETRRSFSMDEWGGPGADKLNQAIFRLSEKAASDVEPSRRARLQHDLEHELEDTYFKAFTKALRERGVRGTCE